MQEILKPASQEYEKAMSDSSSENIPKRLPIGAEILSDGAVHFRVWAPRSQRVEVIIGGGACTEAVIELNGERNGYFSARSPLARPGDLYRYRLDRNPTPAAGPCVAISARRPAGTVHDHRSCSIPLA